MVSVRDKRSLANLTCLLSFFLLLQIRVSHCDTATHDGDSLDDTELGSSSNLLTSESSLTDKVASVTTSSASPTQNSSTMTATTQNVGDNPPINTGDENSGAKENDHIKHRSPAFLLYEVQRDMMGLSLEAVEYALDLGTDVFAFSLADKLGYLENDNDPHISVIEANKEKLIEKLELLRRHLQPPTTLEPAIAATTEPSPAAGESTSLNSRIAYDIVTKIRRLSLEAINQLLSYDSELGSLPYALCQELGYDEDENGEHFQYLSGKGESVLRDILKRAREALFDESQENSEQRVEPNSPIADKSSTKGEPSVPIKTTNEQYVDEESSNQPSDNEDNPGNNNLTDEGGNEEIGDIGNGEDDESAPVNENQSTLDENKESDEEPLLNAETENDLFDQLIKDTYFLNFLIREEKDLYMLLKERNLDEETLDELLEEYTKWLDGLSEEEEETGNGTDFNGEMKNEKAENGDNQEGEKEKEEEGDKWEEEEGGEDWNEGEGEWEEGGGTELEEDYNEFGDNLDPWSNADEGEYNPGEVEEDGDGGPEIKANVNPKVGVETSNDRGELEYIEYYEGKLHVCPALISLGHLYLWSVSNPLHSAVTLLLLIFIL